MKLISQLEAAELKGVSRQNIHKLSRRVWEFFAVDQDGDNMIDIEHPHWLLYMEGKKPEKPPKPKKERPPQAEKAPKKAVNATQPGIEKVPVSEDKRHTGQSQGKKTTGPAEKKGGPGKAAGARKPAGKRVKKIVEISPDEGVDVGEELSYYKPTSLKELKTYTEVQLKAIEMQEKLGNLVRRDIIESRLREMGQSIQMFVDLGRRTSTRICQKVERVGMEKEIEKIINEEVKKLVQDFKNQTSKKIGG
ncbi:MAG: hypothetical protein CVV44_03945 [Spirochaetae bacterium HGW-Spirochaetae-1]|jgi:hypothetical protein|nr:MAG: hypothetical protein CVV44_03945 [Spirochaetae bacterium HGW-Spirochaetae-1]